MFAVNWKEDSTPDILGRVTARNATGLATGINGEGKFLKIADIDNITAQFYNLTSDPDGESPTPLTLVVADVILDTPDATEEVWKLDDVGYNFIHTPAASLFATGGSIYRIEYRFELVGGEVFHEYFEGPALPIFQT